MARLRADMLGGLLTATVQPSDTTFQSATFALMPTVTAPDYLVIVVDPETPSPEICWVTAHTAGASSVTVARAAEAPGAFPAVGHNIGAQWITAATVKDFDGRLIPATSSALPASNTLDPGMVVFETDTGSVQLWTGSAWQTWLPAQVSTWSPSWSTAATQPNIGNGTLQGFFVHLGKLLTFQLYFLAGSSTQFGSGAWTFSLPGVASFTSGTPTPAVGVGANVVAVSAASASYAGFASVAYNGSGVFSPVVFSVSGTAITSLPITASLPFTWSAGASLQVSGTFLTS